MVIFLAILTQTSCDSFADGCLGSFSLEMSYLMILFSPLTSPHADYSVWYDRHPGSNVHSPSHC